MTSSGALELGRTAAVERRWADAYERLIRADAEAESSQEPLPAADLELLATVTTLCGRGPEAVEILTRAHEAYLHEDDQVGAIRTAGWIAIGLVQLGELARGGGWVARGQHLAEELTEPSSVVGLVEVTPTLLKMFAGDIAEATSAFEQIGTIAARFRDRELGALASFGLGQCLLAAGSSGPGFARLDEAMVAVTAGEVSPIPSGIIYCGVVGACHMAFDLRRALEWTAALDRWCRAQSQLVAFTGQCHAHRAALFLVHGAWDEASTAVELAGARLRAGDFDAAFGANYQRAELHRLRGEFRPAEEHYRRAGETPWEPQPGLALLHLAEGNAPLAQSMIQRSAGGSDEGTRRSLLPAVVEIAIAAGDLGTARQAADELGALSAAAPTPMLTALAAFAAGQVLLSEGDAPAAFTKLRDALTAWRSLDAPYHTARCRVLMGRAFQALGDDAAATVEFDSARATFAELGAAPALAELDALAGGHRAGPLTEREVEVLRLVSTGLTNRDVAARLSLSEKTVARHLSNIFGKLGISSRAAATAYAYEHRLV